MTQRVVTKTPTSAVSVNPLGRWVRTIVQAVIAFGAAEPTLIAGLHFTGVRASEIAAIVAALVALASGAQNLAEKLGWLPVAGGKSAAAPATKPTPVPTA